MAIPEYPGLMRPVLQALAETRGDLKFEPLLKIVGSRLGLTAQELSAPLPSGSDTVFGNRLHWALAYLERSGAVQERQGHYRPASSGVTPPPMPVEARVSPVPPAAEGPGALIEASAQAIHQRLASDLLGRIHGESRSSSSA